MERRVISSIYEATEILKNFLESKGYTVKAIKKAHFDRHRIFEVEKKIPSFAGYKIKRYKVYLIYQREPLRYFSKIYKYKVNTDGVGINYEVLKALVDGNFCLVFFAFRDGRLYAGDPEEILDFATQNGWIRTSKKTGEKIVNYPTSDLSLVNI